MPRLTCALDLIVRNPCTERGGGGGRCGGALGTVTTKLFLILSEVGRGGSIKPLPWTFKGQILACSGHCFRDCPGKTNNAAEAAALMEDRLSSVEIPHESQRIKGQILVARIGFSICSILPRTLLNRSILVWAGIWEAPESVGSYLVQARLTESLLLNAQVADFGHELVRVHEETGAEKEGEDVRPLQARGRQRKA